MPDFEYDNSILENVTSYKYLGIMMHKNGKTKVAIKDRITKANQAIFTLKKTLGNPYLATPDLALTLFNKQIEPILLYGSCTWEQRLNKCIYI